MTPESRLVTSQRGSERLRNFIHSSALLEGAISHAFRSRALLIEEAEMEVYISLRKPSDLFGRHEFSKAPK